MLRKERLFLITFLLCLFHLHAQEKNKIALGIETGLLISSDVESLGLLLHVEPKFKINENSRVGLRFALGVNSRSAQEEDSFQYTIDQSIGNTVYSILPTYDYYFKTDENTFRPFLGLGLGYYFLNNQDVSRSPIVNPDTDVFTGAVNDGLGFLVRSGFEIAKFRFGLEYNFIPKADIIIANGQTLGTVNDSYFGISIGLTLGGEKKAGARK